MGDVRELTVPELDVLCQKRPEPTRKRKPKKRDYRLLRAWITNLILLVIICIMAVVIWVLQAGPV